MARIRTIKPEFPQSESMGNVSREARLCFILLWTIADDSGRLRGTSRMLASLLYPYDDDAKDLIDGWLCELSREHCIAIYSNAGATYLQVLNWTSHQKIDKPSQSKIPAFDESSRILANVRECSSEDQGRDQGKEGIKEGIGPKESPRKRGSSSSDIPKPEDVLAQTWEDYLKVRKAKKAGAASQTAIDGIRKEAAIANISMEDALATCCKRNWVGFEAEWLNKTNGVNGHMNKQEALEFRNKKIADDFMREREQTRNWV